MEITAENKELIIAKVIAEIESHRDADETACSVRYDEKGNPVFSWILWEEEYTKNWDEDCKDIVNEMVDKAIEIATREKHDTLAIYSCGDNAEVQFDQGMTFEEHQEFLDMQDKDLDLDMLFWLHD